MTPAERDLAIRTIIGEASNQPFKGKVGVAAVILNRAKDGGYGGDSVRDVVLAPKQFEPWSTRRSELLGYSKDSPAYQSAAEALDAAESGQDPTGGATHFANVGTVRQRGDSAGRSGGWLSRMVNSGNTVTIGGHTFGKANAGRLGSSTYAGNDEDDEDEDTPETSTGAGKGSGTRRTRTARGGSGGGGTLNPKDLYALLYEPTDHPGRLQLRELAHDILSDMQVPAGQGHAVVQAGDVGEMDAPSALRALVSSGGGASTPLPPVRPDPPGSAEATAFEGTPYAEAETP
jgi:hypothetical protein